MDPNDVSNITSLQTALAASHTPFIITYQNALEYLGKVGVSLYNPNLIFSYPIFSVDISEHPFFHTQCQIQPFHLQKMFLLADINTITAISKNTFLEIGFHLNYKTLLSPIIFTDHVYNNSHACLSQYTQVFFFSLNQSSGGAPYHALVIQKWLECLQSGDLRSVFFLTPNYVLLAACIVHRKDTYLLNFSDLNWNEICILLLDQAQAFLLGSGVQLTEPYQYIGSPLPMDIRKRLFQFVLGDKQNPSMIFLKPKNGFTELSDEPSLARELASRLQE